MTANAPMQWEIIRHESPPLIWIKVSGTFDVTKCKGIFDEIAEVKGSNPFFPILIDDRNADLSGLAPTALIDLGHLFQQNQAIFAYSKIAVLMNPGSDLETARRFKSITRGTSFVTFDIFSDEKEALTWIQS